MKKIAFRSITLLLCLALLCPLTACSDSAKLLRLEGAERADAFFDIVNEDPGETYTVEMKMEMTGSLYGVRLEAEIESDSTYIGYRGSSPIYHSEGSSKITVGSDGAETVQSTKSFTGYRDGKLYEKYNVNGVETALVSAISADDYKAHQESLVGFTDEELSALHKSATVKDCVQNEDGTWSATFSGYSEESVASLINYCFDQTVLLLDGYKPKDIVFTIETDEKFLPTDWDYEIVFESTDSTNVYPKPVAKAEIEFDDIGTAEAPEIDLASFTEVEGLADLQKIRHTISDKFIADSFTFTAKSSQKVTYDSSIQFTEETDNVTVKTNGGKYAFDIAAKVVYPGIIGGTNVTITFKDGVFTMSGKDIATQTQEMSDSSARAYISKLYDPAGLSSAQISDIALNSAGHTHVFTLANPDYSALEASLASMGAGNVQANASIGVDYENGVLSAYEYNMTVTARVKGLKLTIEIKSEVTFDN